MDKRYEKTMSRISIHAERAQEYAKINHYIWLGTFLIGSQNYLLDTDKSDVDSISLFVPTVEQLAAMSPKDGMLSSIYLYEGENLYFKDIRQYISELKGMSMNALEVLVTDFKEVNPDYNILAPLFKRSEDISFYAPYKLWMVIRGTFKSQRRNLFTQTINNMEVFKREGYNSKAVARMFQLRDFMYKSIHNEGALKERLVPYKVDTVKDIQSGALSLDEVNSWIEETDVWMNNQCKGITDVWACADQGIQDFFNKFLLDVFKTVFYKQFVITG